jgi:hypothetical protein
MAWQTMRLQFVQFEGGERGCSAELLSSATKVQQLLCQFPMNLLVLPLQNIDTSEPANNPEEEEEARAKGSDSPE